MSEDGDTAIDECGVVL